MYIYEYIDVSKCINIITNYKSHGYNKQNDERKKFYIALSFLFTNAQNEYFLSGEILGIEYLAMKLFEMNPLKVEPNQWCGKEILIFRTWKVSAWTPQKKFKFDIQRINIGKWQLMGTRFWNFCTDKWKCFSFSFHCFNPISDGIKNWAPVIFTKTIVFLFA